MRQPQAGNLKQFWVAEVCRCVQVLPLIPRFTETAKTGPGNYDGKFDAAPDIDHGNKKAKRWGWEMADGDS